MIKELEIQNFRGFGRLKLENLGRINLLLGGNDTGKTSILEALVLLLGDGRAVQTLSTTFRSNQSGIHPQQSPDDYENFWLWLFREKDPKNQIAISCKTDIGDSVKLTSKSQVTGSPGTQQRLLDREYSKRREQVVSLQNGQAVLSAALSSPHGSSVSCLSVRPTSPVEDAERYNLVALNPDGERKVEEVMRVIEPRLRRLRYAKLPGTSSPLVFADLGLARALPSTQMGQAFNRVLHIYCEILSQQANLLLVDEIENGVFTESMPDIWRGLLAICATEDVQIFATTHSRECVMAALRAAEEREKDELMVFRLQRVHDEVEAIRLEAKHLELAAELGLEVRS
ncbi:MAG: AAA family ATPase [Verrucomicrobiales bacterium]|nr:AAA family ATPase [Verrucomicrobiales bacterium]